MSTLASSARADGYFEGIQGAHVTARGGAAVASTRDLAAVQLNPAGLTKRKGTFVHAGNRFSHNAHRFERSPTLDWGNTVDGMPPLVEHAAAVNDHRLQLLDPMLGVASDFGLESVRAALAIYAPAGIGRQDFELSGAQRYMMVSRDSKLLHVDASGAYAVTSELSIGLSVQWITVPELEYSLVVDGVYFPGRANPISSVYDMLATIEGSDPFTLNLILGASYRPVRFLELGVSGQVLPSELAIDSTLAIEPLNPEIAQGGVRLLRDGMNANDVTLTLPLPVTARAGVRYIHLQGRHELFDLELALGYEAWSVVDAFTLDSHGLVAQVFGQEIDLGVIEIEKRWRDTLSVHVGGDYHALMDLLTLSAGAFYESALSPPSYVHVDFVGAAQLGGALGVTLHFDAFEIVLAYELRQALQARVTEDQARVYQEVPASQCEPPYTDSDLCHPEYPGAPSPAVNAGSYDARSSTLALDVLYKL